LWFSVLLRPGLLPQETTRLTIAFATALRRAIVEHTGLQPEIKWPNDLLLSGKKIAGILTELNAELDHVRYVILGVGVDVNLATSDFPDAVRSLATSLKIAAGRPISRPALAVAILREFDADYARVCSGQFAAVANEWEEHCSTLGREVSIRIGQREVRGRAESLSPEGELLVRTEHGRLERVGGGDVSQSST
jgi:BirA family biotin operon repressor/biotin-[acetyl-CoA-carboxylase] ligase